MAVLPAAAVLLCGVLCSLSQLRVVSAVALPTVQGRARTGLAVRYARQVLEEGTATDAEGHASKGRVRRLHLEHPQYCQCPRSLQQVRDTIEALAGPQGMDESSIQQAVKESKESPICTFNTTATPTATEIIWQQEIQRDFQRSVAVVCPLRKKIIFHRRLLHCMHVRHVEQVADGDPEKEVKMYEHRHFNQMRTDKSRDCSQLESGAPPRKRTRRGMIRLEVELVKKKALVEAIPAVMVLGKLRHLILTTLKPQDFFYHRGSSQDLRDMLSNLEGSRKHMVPLQTLMEYLPGRLPDKRYGTCAVVGNAGMLKLFRHGDLIDNHDLVIRVNQGPSGRDSEKNPSAARFRPYVGSRTDVRILNRKWTELYSSRYGSLIFEDPTNVTYYLTRADPKYVNYLGDRLKNKGGAPRDMLWMNDRIVREGLSLLRAAREGIQEGLGVKFLGGSSPSSGFIALHTALHMCKEVNVFGFTIGNCYGACQQKNNYHYFDATDVPDRELTWNHEAHSFGLEGLVLKAMHILGILCIVPPPAGLGHCGTRLNGLLDQLSLLEDAEVGKTHKLGLNDLLNDRNLLGRLSSFRPALDPLYHMYGAVASGDSRPVVNPAELRSPGNTIGASNSSRPPIRVYFRQKNPMKRRTRLHRTPDTAQRSS